MTNAFLLGMVLLAGPRPDAAYTRAALREGASRCGGACNQMAILQTASLEQKLTSMKLAGVPAADVVRSMQWELKDLKEFPFDKIDASARDDARAIVGWRIGEIEAAFATRDPEKVKAARIAQTDALAALLAKGALEAGLSTDLPTSLKVNERIFRGVKDADLSGHPYDFDTLDLRASAAADQAATANTLLGLVKDGALSDADASRLYETARARGIPVGDSDDARARLIAGLEAAAKQADDRLARMRKAYADWDKLQKSLPPTPSIGLPSRPMPPPAFLSPQQMVADGLIPGTGAANFGAKRIGFGTAITGPLNAINTGYSLGGWYENSALMNFQMAERERMRSEYRERLADWEKNVKPLIEENKRRCEEEAKRPPSPEAQRILARDARLALILGGGLNPEAVIRFLSVAGAGSPPSGGSNVPRYGFPTVPQSYRPLAPIGGGQQR